MRDGFISDLVSKWGACFGVRENIFSNCLEIISRYGYVGYGYVGHHCVPDLYKYSTCILTFNVLLIYPLVGGRYYCNAIACVPDSGTACNVRAVL